MLEQDQVATQTQDTNQAQEPGSSEAAAAAIQNIQTQPATPAPTGLDALKQKASQTINQPMNPTQQQQAAAVEAYKANFKFKAAGKEHEVPEFLRGVMKDKDSEKFVHDLFEKAYGLPSLKQRFQETRGQLQQTEQAFNQVIGQVDEARQAYQRGDMGSVFEIMRIAPEKVLQWAVEQVQLSQLPPEQRHAHEARRAAEKRAHELEKTNQTMSTEQSQQQSEQLSQMLELVLERQDISAVAQAYDSRKGKDGSFRDLVVLMGETEFSRSGKLITPLEAAKKAIELLGESQANAAQTAAPAAAPVTPATPANPVQPKAQRVTLPNLASASGKATASPAKSKMRSIDDLKKKHQEMMGQ